jgi:hypothetical protein
MHAVIRTYSGSGATELFDLLEKRKSDVESLMRPIQGFVSYDLVRTASGGTSITVCQSKSGTDESVRRARQWIATNASDVRASDPAVSEGPVIVHLRSEEEAAAGTSAAIPLGTA